MLLKEIIGDYKITVSNPKIINFRNKKILISVLHGATLQNAAKEFGLSAPRIRSIVYQEIGYLKLSFRPSLMQLRAGKNFFLSQTLKVMVENAT
jgi:hypothetical protein